jgi:hypothetical protein
MTEEEREKVLKLVRVLLEMNMEMALPYVVRDNEKLIELSREADVLLKESGFQWRDGQLFWKE